MQRGYIKVWRKIADAGWLKNHKLCAFWLWCLLKATHKEYDLIVGCQMVHLMPGEFVFGLKAASKELKMGIQSIRTLLDFLKNTQNLTLKTTNKFSIITIVNWSTYQIDDYESNTQSNKQLTNNQQTTNNKQEHKNKRIKETNISDLVLPQNIKPETWNAYLEMRKVIKKPATLHAQKLIINKLLTMRDDPNKILEQSIQNSYQGVFPLKEETNAGTYASKKPFRTERDAINQAAADEADIINRERAERIARENKTAATN